MGSPKKTSGTIQERSLIRMARLCMRIGLYLAMFAKHLRVRFLRSMGMKHFVVSNSGFIVLRRTSQVASEMEFVWSVCSAPL